MIKDEYGDEMNKKDLIKKLVEWDVDPEELKEMSKKELEELYEELWENRNDESIFHPNGRDYDA